MLMSQVSQLFHSTMVSTSDEEGESSSQTSNADERPLKKARYIWQIKGKYHLKKPDEDERGHQISICESSVTSEDYTTLEVVDLKCVDDLQDKLTKKSIPLLPNFRLDSVENKRELESPSPCSSYEMYRLSDTISNMELTKWQDRQVARCLVDNTINRVLEVMGFIPSESVDISGDEYRLQSNETLEDEAVLMAIHSHGLQMERENQVSGTKCSNKDGVLTIPCMCRHHTSNHTQILNPFHKRPVTSLPIDLDQLNYINPPRRSCIGNPEAANPTSTDEESIAVPKVTDPSGSDETEESKPLDDLKSNGPEDNIVPESAEEIIPPLFDHNDFLDQAVSAAIKKKGLGTFCSSDLG